MGSSKLGAYIQIKKIKVKHYFYKKRIFFVQGSKRLPVSKTAGCRERGLYRNAAAGKRPFSKTAGQEADQMSVVTAVRLLRQPDVAVFDAAVKRGQNGRRFRVKAFSLIFFQSMRGRLKFELVISGHGLVDFVDCVFTADFFPFGIQSARQFPYLPLNDQTVRR